MSCHLQFETCNFLSHFVIFHQKLRDATRTCLFVRMILFVNFHSLWEQIYIICYRKLGLVFVTKDHQNILFFLVISLDDRGSSLLHDIIFTSRENKFFFESES